MEHLPKHLAEVEADEYPDSDNEDNGLEDVLEEIFEIMKVSASMIRNRKRTWTFYAIKRELENDILPSIFELYCDRLHLNRDNPFGHRNYVDEKRPDK
ncbi:hypothetical protein AVEN_192757-1 [Araneus ventricosus]|uniref:Uncharacterized protein n=1 Tax=Araneus ventricosus TaxID=182803 RepID=A0A4Y2EQ45_ARAVE|nr:hypothetical protein AVEN_192757-1 [Araneus ventricosus]